MAPHKRETVAGMVRDMIADGALKPGAPAPSGAALARETGFCTLTCRKALRALSSMFGMPRDRVLPGRIRVNRYRRRDNGDIARR